MYNFLLGYAGTTVKSGPLFRHTEAKHAAAGQLHHTAGLGNIPAIPQRTGIQKLYLHRPEKKIKHPEFPWVLSI